MSYEKDKLDSYVTSASLTTALAPYVTSNSLSAAISGINLAPYVTSDSLSAAVATDALTVRGTASVSATLSAAAVTVAGYPVGAVVLGYQAVNNTQSIAFSGSWSDYPVMELRATYLMSGTATASLGLFTDGGTTAFFTLQTGANSPYGPNLIEFIGRVMGNGGSQKYANATWFRTTDTTAVGAYSATANSGFINCIKLRQSKTMSSGMAILIGYRAT